MLIRLRYLHIWVALLASTLLLQFTIRATTPSWRCKGDRLGLHLNKTNLHNGKWKCEIEDRIVTKLRWFGYIIQSPRSYLFTLDFELTYHEPKWDTKPNLLVYTNADGITDDDPKVSNPYAPESTARCFQRIKHKGNHKFSNLATSLHPDRNYNCKRQQSNVTCKGKIGFRMPTAMVFYIAIADCQSSKGLNMNYTMTVDNFTESECEEIKFAPCKKLYKRTRYPNALGYLSQLELFPTPDVIAFIYAAYKKFNCYQHTMLMGCAYLYPPCENATAFSPCKEACIQYVQGCHGNYLMERFGLNKLNCDYAAPYSTGPGVQCLYKEVNCGKLEPFNGTVTSNGTTLYSKAYFQCEKGMELQGNKERMCTFSGEWTGANPVCMEIQANTLLTPLIVSSIFLVAIVLVIAGGYFKKEIRILLFVRFGLAICRPPHEDRMKYDGFICHDSQDEEYAKEILRYLEDEHEPPFRMCVHFRDFCPGRSIIENINEAIHQSSRNIILLSPNFLQSSWCRFEFEQAYHKEIHEDPQSLIVIIVEDFQKVDIPEDIATYQKTHTYIRYGDRLFWDRLVYALPHVKPEATLNQERGDSNSLKVNVEGTESSF